jgi:hypothetical protein
MLQATSGIQVLEQNVLVSVTMMQHVEYHITRVCMRAADGRGRGSPLRMVPYHIISALDTSAQISI